MSYDPRQAFNDRKTTSAKKGDARKASSGQSNIGGNDSNYRGK